MKRILYLLLALPALAVAQPVPEAPPKTVIESDKLMMKGGEEQNVFVFSENVQLLNENLTMSCERLEVIANRVGDEDATVGEFGVIESITAAGNVVIRQGDRVAYAGLAEVDPQAGVVVLSDSPRIIDRKAEVRGWKIVLNRDEKTAQVIPAPDEPLYPGAERERSRVVLTDDALPDLNYENLPPEPEEGGETEMLVDEEEGVVVQEEPPIPPAARDPYEVDEQESDEDLESEDGDAVEDRIFDGDGPLPVDGE